MLLELLQELRPRQGPLVADELRPEGLHEPGELPALVDEDLAVLGPHDARPLQRPRTGVRFKVCPRRP